VYSRSLTGAQRETAKVEEMVLRVCKGFTQGVHRGYKGGTQGVQRVYTGGTKGLQRVYTGGNRQPHMLG